MNPSVSVVVPCYRSGSFVEEAVDSIICQTFSDWECILIDDGSDDEPTRRALQRITNRSDERIRLLTHAGHANRGVSESRNLGLDHAQGRFIAFLDSDDAWLPDKLERQVHVLDSATPNVGLVFCDFWESVEADPARPMSEQPLRRNAWGGSLAEWFDGVQGKTIHAMLREPPGRLFNWVQSPTPLVRRGCFAGDVRFVGPPAMPTQFEDYLMWLILAAKYDFIALSEPLAIYRVHSKAFTSRFNQENETRALRHFEGMDAVVNLFGGSGVTKDQSETLKAKWRKQAMSRVERAQGKYLRRLALFSFQNRCVGPFSMALSRRWFNKAHYAIRRTWLFVWCRAIWMRKSQGNS